MNKRRVAILGSTGSIGRQALDVIRQHRDLFEVELLTANNSSELLIAQAREFDVNSAVICNEEKYDEVASALQKDGIKVFAGMDSVCSLVGGSNIDIVLTAMVGFSGLASTVAAIKAGKAIALANKETLVAAGSLVTALAREHGVPLLPVDSEHSAIFQCLVGEEMNEVDKILLTCSGGPFRNFTHEQLLTVTAADALRHPTWKMGAKITIDSASLMNKGFEVMEAKWLFGVPAEKIEVLVHPQSVVHSGVQFKDGAVKAQLGVPDMRLPIQYAFSFPKRLPLNGDRLDLFSTRKLEFFKPDVQKFPCLRLAYEAISEGGNMPCILNAANEVANAAFRRGECSFLGMAEVIERTMRQASFDKTPNLDTYFQTDAEARQIAVSLLKA